MLRNADRTTSNAYLRVQRRFEDRHTLRDEVTAWIYRTPIQGSTPDDPDDALAVAQFIDRYCDAHAASARAALALALQNAVTDGDRARLAGRYDREIAGARAFLRADEITDPDEKARTSRVRAALVFIESYRELPLLAWPRAVLDGLIAFEQAFVIFRQRHARMVERVYASRALDSATIARWRGAGVQPAAPTTWTSMSSSIASLTRTPPVSRAAFHTRPQRLRRSEPVAR